MKFCKHLIIKQDFFSFFYFWPITNSFWFKRVTECQWERERERRGSWRKLQKNSLEHSLYFVQKLLMTDVITLFFALHIVHCDVIKNIPTFKRNGTHSLSFSFYLICIVLVCKSFEFHDFFFFLSRK